MTFYVRGPVVKIRGPLACRYAAFNSLIHRLTRIPLNQSAFRNELQTMKHLARVNEVNVEIDLMVRRKITRDRLGSTISLPRDSYRDSTELVE